MREIRVGNGVDYCKHSNRYRKWYDESFHFLNHYFQRKSPSRVHITVCNRLYPRASPRLPQIEKTSPLNPKILRHFRSTHGLQSRQRNFDSRMSQENWRSLSTVRALRPHPLSPIMRNRTGHSRGVSSGRPAPTGGSPSPSAEAPEPLRGVSRTCPRTKYSQSC